MYIKSLNTKWTLRTRKMRARYIETEEVIVSAIQQGRGSGIRNTAKETEQQMWAGRVAQKLALGIYKTSKTEIKQGQFFDNTKGSSLLFKGRAGTLRIRNYR